MQMNKYEWNKSISIWKRSNTARMHARIPEKWKFPSAITHTTQHSQHTGKVDKMYE